MACSSRSYLLPWVQSAMVQWFAWAATSPISIWVQRRNRSCAANVAGRCARSAPGARIIIIPYTSAGCFRKLEHDSFACPREQTLPPTGLHYDAQVKPGGERYKNRTSHHRPPSINRKKSVNLGCSQCNL